MDCHVCKEEIGQYDPEYSVNLGLESEFYLCASCQKEAWQKGMIAMCEVCGEWFTMDAIKTITLPNGDAMTPCPYCGRDMVTGRTKKLQTIAG